MPAQASAQHLNASRQRTLFFWDGNDNILEKQVLPLAATRGKDTLSKTIEQIVNAANVIPVIVIDDLEDAVPLAQALCAGGLTVLEITLRSPIALQAIEAVTSALPNVTVGAGTVLNARDLENSLKAGAQFIVSPGCTALLTDAALASRIPFLPGIATPSEVMALAERGFTYLKFLPAEAAGGIGILNALNGPFAGIKFCLTGGINPGNALQYLELPNVSCIGGSWMASKDLIAAGRWQEIMKRAKTASEWKS